MREVILQKIENLNSLEEKINKTREYLQTLLLKILFDKDLFNTMAFVGGTALRILYGIRRYSEDLDFCLIQKKGYNFNLILQNIVADLKKYGFLVQAVPKETKTVHSSMIKFPGLMKELSLSPMRNENLSIKLEIDMNPPQGWKTAVSGITEPYLFTIKHFDVPSLFATKIHACFFRSYVKGRDFYDLVWYLGKKTVPNFELLNNAITQTSGKELKISNQNLKDFLAENIKKIDLKKAQKDVERFLEDKNELKLINQETLLQLLDSCF